MAKVHRGVVVDDKLFTEYHKFKAGKTCEVGIVQRLLHFYKHEIVTNIAQYNRTGISLSSNFKAQLQHSGLKQQSLEELAETRSLYRIILSTSRDDFPYVNIMEDNQRLENNFTASFDRGEKRDFALAHIASICKFAKQIILYDKYLASAYLDTIEAILPKKRLDIYHGLDIDPGVIQDLKTRCSDWNFIAIPEIKNRHDRYLIIDNSIEIILSSGFEYLSRYDKDFTYILRPIDSPRFQMP